MKLTLLKKPVVMIPVLAAAVVIGFLLWHARHSSRLVFITTGLKRGDIVSTINSTGTIEPLEVIDVGAQVAGLIQSFGLDTKGKTVDYGSTVEAGTVLARIDDSVYAADLALAKGQLEKDKAGLLSASATVEQAKAKLATDSAAWERAQQLFKRNMVAESDYDTAKSNYEVAKGNVDMGEAAVAQAKASIIIAQATRDKAQRNLDFCVIKSPVKGVIVDRRVNIGQTVVSSLNAPSLFLIAKDLTKMQIWVAVNEADVGRIVPGGAVTFTCDAFPGREFNAAVGKVRLNATMTQNVVMYTVEVNTENPDKLLLPYLTANVHFIVGRETDALLAPNAALRWTPSSLPQILPSARRAMAAELQMDPAGPGSGPNSAAGPAATPAPRRDRPQDRVGVLWVKEGEYVRPVKVKLGLSDGMDTVITGDGLSEGQEVVTGEIAEIAQPDTKNPFMPQIRRR